MHNSALDIARKFHEIYSSNFEKDCNILEIGSKDTCELRNIFNSSNYKGMDLEVGNNVDVVLSDPYVFPFENDSVDIIVTSSCFEHIPHFWLSFLEGIRVLKPNGIFYINAPSAGVVHKYPVDCWRFFPDSAQSLVDWANKSKYNSVLLESFIYNPDPTWKDCVMVILKDKNHIDNHKRRIVDIEGNVTDVNRN